MPNTPPFTLRLLLPEWQGFGLDARVHDGAMVLASELFGGRAVTLVDAPRDEDLQIVDGVLGLHSIAPRFTRALDAVRAAAPARIVTVGGTCGVELAPVAYLNDRYQGDLTVLWIDAHADLNTPASSPSGHFHGMVLRTLTGDGPEACTRAIPRALSPAQIVLVGVRDLDPPEAEYVATHGLAVWGDEMIRDPARAVASLAARGARRLYVHFDVDVLDPTGFPAVLMRTPGGGPSLDEAARFVRALAASFDVAGFSVLEYCDGTPESRQALGRAFRWVAADPDQGDPASS